MVTRRVNDPNAKKTRRPAATTPDGRERQLISHAVDLAERQLLDGSASAQVISHYLKLGSSRERLEQERLEEEVHHLQMKTEALASQKRVEEMYAEALNAMRAYAGHEIVEDDPYDD